MTRKQKANAEDFVRLRMNPELYPFLRDHLASRVARKNWGAAILNLAAIGLATSKLQTGGQMGSEDIKPSTEASGVSERQAATKKPPGQAAEAPSQQQAAVDNIALSAEDFADMSTLFSVPS